MFPSCWVQPHPPSGISALQVSGGYRRVHKSKLDDAPSAKNAITMFEACEQPALAIPAESTTYVIVLMLPLTKGSGHWRSVTGVAETETETHQHGI